MNQTVSSVPITTSFAGDVYDTSAVDDHSRDRDRADHAHGQSGHGDYADATTVSGVLTDTLTNAPIVRRAGDVDAERHRDLHRRRPMPPARRRARITPGEPAATYPLTGSFGGDTTRPLQLMASTGSANFVVTLEETSLTYTGAVTAQNGQPLTVSGVLTTDDPSPDNAHRGPDGHLHPRHGLIGAELLGHDGLHGHGGLHHRLGEPVAGADPRRRQLRRRRLLPDGQRRLDRQPPRGDAADGHPDHRDPTTAPRRSRPRWSTPTPTSRCRTSPSRSRSNSTQTCTATTNASGVASCPVTPTEPAGTYSLTASFPGDSSSMPQLLPNSASSTFTVTPAPTTLTYTGTTSVTNGQPATLSGVLTTNEPSPGTDVAGQHGDLHAGLGQLGSRAAPPRPTPAGPRAAPSPR